MSTLTGLIAASKGNKPNPPKSDAVAINADNSTSQPVANGNDTGMATSHPNGIGASQSPATNPPAQTFSSSSSPSPSSSGDLLPTKKSKIERLAHPTSWLKKSLDGTRSAPSLALASEQAAPIFTPGSVPANDKLSINSSELNGGGTSSTPPVAKTPTKIVLMGATERKKPPPAGNGKAEETQEGWQALWKMLWGGETPARPATDQRPKNSGPSLPTRQKTIVAHLEHTSWVSAMQVALWDNIFGPRVEQVWNGAEELSEDHRMSVARHSLSGEVAEELHLDSEVESKFHIFPGSGHAVLALIFTAPFRNSPSRYSFSLIVSQRHLERYLALHTVIQDHMFRLAYKLRALLLKPSRSAQQMQEAVAHFSKLLPGFTRLMEALFHAVLPPPKYTSVFCAPTLNFKHDFLAKAITAHLMTHCSTVVTGNDEDTVNMFVDSLSLFLTATERKRSCRAVDNRGYIPDLLLQGVVGSHQQPIADQEFLESLLPTTVIDVGKQIVRHTRVYHEYVNFRREYLNADMERLLADSRSSELHLRQHSSGSIIPQSLNFPPASAATADPTTTISVATTAAASSTQESSATSKPASNTTTPPSVSPYSSSSGNATRLATSNLFITLRDPSPYITRVLAEAFKQPPGLREAFVAQSMRLLTRKATVLIRYAQAETAKAETNVLDTEIIRRIRTDLKLASDSDFLVLLGIAEKLWPGIYLTLAGDPLLMEERFIELFDSFALG